MKKFIIIVLSSITVMSFVACRQEPRESTMQIPNPFVDCTTLEEAQTLAGFNMTIPEAMPEGFLKSAIRVIENKMIEIIYLNGESEIRIRKAIGSEDISGDYTIYKEENEVDVGSAKVIMKGDKGKVKVSTWSVGEYVFSITANIGETGLDGSVILNMVNAVN